jgi:hypothetical protein
VSRHVHEPRRSSLEVRNVPEERPGAEHHVPGARFTDGRPRRVPRRNSTAPHARCRRGGIDDRSCRWWTPSHPTSRSPVAYDPSSN